MNEGDRRQAEWLEQWSTIADGEDALSVHFDGSMATLVGALSRGSRIELPDQRFVTGLRERIEQRAGELQAAPARRRPIPLASRWVAGGLVAAGLVAASLAALLPVTGILQGDGGTPGAAEILRAAQAAAASPEAHGLQSFEFTATGTSFMVDPVNNPLAEFVQADGSITYRTHIWYQAPDRRRAESEVVDAAGNGHRPIVTVWDGTNVWTHQVWNNKVTVRESDESDSGRELAIGWPNAGDLDALLEEAERCYDARVVGEETIAGRPAHIIDLGPRQCPPEGARRMIWVDQETGFVLKDEQHSWSGDDALNWRGEITRIEYNVAVDPERFTFTPPDHASVQEEPEFAAISTPATVYDSVADAQEVSTFHIKVPKQLPEGYELEVIRHFWPVSVTEAQIANGTARWDWLFITYRNPSGDSLRIHQGHFAPFLSWEYDAPEGKAGRIEVNGQEAIWIEGRPAGGTEWVQDGRATLAIPGDFVGDSRRNTVLQSDVLSVEELIAIAESLE